MTVQTEIQELVEVYRAAWNARDFEGMAALFTEPATYVVPNGTLHIPDRLALIEKLKQQFAGLENNGFNHTEIESVEARQCNETTAMANLKNVARLRADGSAIDVIDAVYVCINQEGCWRLSIAMACWTDWKAAPGSGSGRTDPELHSAEEIMPSHSGIGITEPEAPT